jgi:uncharacterized repeat protein (TIGR01451 family)
MGIRSNHALCSLVVSAAIVASFLAAPVAWSQIIETNPDQYYGLYSRNLDFTDWGIEDAVYSGDGKRILVANRYVVTFFDAQTLDHLDTLVVGVNASDRLGTIRSLDVSADGRRLAVASGSAVSVWDMETLTLIRWIQLPTFISRSVSFSPNGEELIVGPSGPDTNRTSTNASIYDIDRGNVRLFIPMEERVQSVDYSPNGSLVAVGTSDNNIHVYDAASGIDTITIAMPSTVTGLDFSPDSNRILAVSGPKTAVFDLATGEELAEFAGSNFLPSRASFSPSGTTVLTGHFSGEVGLWDAGTGENLFRGMHATEDAAMKSVLGISFSPDGQRFVSAGENRSVIVWDTATSAPTAAVQGHNLGVQQRQLFAVDVSADGTKVATGAEDGSIRIWDQESGTLLATLDGHESAVNALAFIGDGATLVSGSADTTVRVWDTETGLLQESIDAHSAAVNAVAASTESGAFVTGDDAGVAIFHSASKGILELSGHAEAITDADFSQDGSRFATSSRDDTVRIWDGATGSALNTFTVHTGDVFTVALNHDGTQALSAGNEFEDPFTFVRGRVWDTDTGEFNELFFPKLYSPPRRSDYSPDGQQVVFTMSSIEAGNSVTSVSVWNVATGELSTEYRLRQDGLGSVRTNDVVFLPSGSGVVSASALGVGHLWPRPASLPVVCVQINPFSSINAVRFSPRGRELVLPTDEGLILWDIQSQETVLQYSKSVGFTGVDMSLDGASVVAATSSSAMIFDGVTGDLVHTLGGDTNEIRNRVQFSPDGSRLMTGGESQLFDVASGEVVHDFDDFGAFVAYSPGGTLIATASGGSLDKEIFVWDAATGSLVFTQDFQDGRIVRGLDFAPYGDTIATSLTDPQNSQSEDVIQLWDARTGAIIQTITSFIDKSLRSVGEVKFGPRGRFLLVATDEGRAALYDTISFRVVRQFGVPGGLNFSAQASIASMDFSPDATLVAIGMTDGRVCLFETGADPDAFRKATPIGLNDPQSAICPSGGVEDYELILEQGEATHLLARLTPTDHVTDWNLLAGYEHFPSFSFPQYQDAGVPPSSVYEVLIPNALPGSYIFTVRFKGFGSPPPTGYTIEIFPIEKHLSSSDLTDIGNAGAIDIALNGLGFEGDMAFEVRATDGTLIGTFQPQLDGSLPTRATVQLDLQDVPAQQVSLVARWADGTTRELPGGLRIVQGAGPNLSVHCHAPNRVRALRPYVLWLEYENVGDANMEPVLITITPPPGVTMQGSGGGAFSSRSVQVLSIGKTPPFDVLRPGDRVRIPFTFMADQTIPGHEIVVFTTATAFRSTQPIDWDGLEDEMRPEDVTDEEWSTVVSALRVTVGETYASLYDYALDNTQLLIDRGLDPSDLGSLIGLIAEDALGLPTAVVGGIVCERDTILLLNDVVLRLVSDDDTVIIQAQSDEEGKFAFAKVPDGSYRIFAEGYSVSDPDPIVVADQVGVASVLVKLFIPEEESSDPIIVLENHHPSLTPGFSTDTHLTWERGGEVWWAKWNNSQLKWEQSKQVADAVGSMPDIGYATNMLGDGATPGMVVVWERPRDDDDISILEWSVGEEIDDDWEFTTPVALTSDTADDFAPAVTPLSTGEPLVIWLQADLAIDDDTDVYSDAIDVTTAGDLFVVKLLTADDLKQVMISGNCVTATLAKGSSLPTWIPVIGGKYGFAVKGKVCGTLNCDEISRSGELSVAVDIGKYLKGTGKIAGSEKWVIDTKACEYIFNLAQLQMGLDIDATFKSPSIPIIIGGIPVGTAEGKVTLGTGYTGTVQWHANFPGLPDSGFVDMQLRGGLQGNVKLAKGLIEGKVAGNVSGTYRYIPPGNVDFLGYCIKLDAEGKAIFGLLKKKWVKTWSAGTVSCSKHLFDEIYAKGGHYEEYSDDYVLFMYASEVKQVQGDDVQLAETLSYEQFPDNAGFIGTGAVHEGVPILADVATDLFDDDAPAIARSRNGEVLALWAKNTGDYATAIGATVVTAEFNGSTWDAPNDVDSAINYNKDADVAFDSSSNPMALWSSASSTGLTSASTVEELMAVEELSDIIFSKRTSGVWGAPQVLFALDGRDEAPAIAGTNTGSRMAATWLNINGGVYSIYASNFDGSIWSEPVALGTAVQADAPTIAATSTSNGYLVVWAQDTDDEIELTTDWHLRYATFDGTAWSTANTYPHGNFEDNASNQVEGKEALAVKEETIFATAKDMRLPAPRTCCDPPDDDVPGSIPLGEEIIEISHETLVEVVQSNDPNEKDSTLGIGPGRAVEAGDTIDYVVYFENKSTAAVPAQEVFITDILTPDLDWSTFEVTAFGWGDQIVTVTEPKSDYLNRVTIGDWRDTVVKSWWLDLLVQPDFTSGLVKWTFQTIDPDTNDLPADVDAGFLPPNDDTGRGEGHVAFRIKVKDDVPNGTVIRNEASIVFDVNEPIITNEIFNTIGLEAGCVPSTNVNSVDDVDAIDVQLTINGVLGIAIPAGVEVDTNCDGSIDAVDVQRVINAALGIA